jgi:hypothetical protein
MKEIPNRQVAYVPMPNSFNDIKIVFDARSDNRNLALFAKYKAVKVDGFYSRKQRSGKKAA